MMAFLKGLLLAIAAAIAGMVLVALLLVAIWQGFSSLQASISMLVCLLARAC